MSEVVKLIVYPVLTALIISVVTIIHELGHALMILAGGGKIGSIAHYPLLWPKKKSITLGIFKLQYSAGGGGRCESIGGSSAPAWQALNAIGGILSNALTGIFFYYASAADHSYQTDFLISILSCLLIMILLSTLKENKRSYKSLIDVAIVCACVYLFIHSINKAILTSAGIFSALFIVDCLLLFSNLFPFNIQMGDRIIMSDGMRFIGILRGIVRNHFDRG